MKIHEIFLFCFLLTCTEECPPLYEVHHRNNSLCQLCPIGKVKITYDSTPCIFYNKETFGYPWSEVHEAIYKITYAFRDLLPDEIMYNNQTRWSSQACVMKSITKGDKEKKRITSKILNLIYRFIRERDIYDKL